MDASDKGGLTLSDIAARLAASPSAAQLFGADLDTAARVRRELARVCILAMVDGAPADLRALAESTLAGINALYDQLNAPSKPSIVLGKWGIVAPLHKGAVGDLYSAYAGSTPAVVKIAHHPRDNDLLRREHEALKYLQADARWDSTLSRYVPTALDAFEASGRRVNVTSYASECLSLVSIKSQLGSAVPFVHIVWMMNRLLSLLGFIHRLGLVHGAITPNHLLYRPSDHGLVLVDWTCASRTDQRIPYVSTSWRDLYPIEVLFSKGRCSPSTDIYMAFSSLRYAADAIPYRFRSLFDLCLLESCNSRPDDAWLVQDKWKKLALDEFGKPKFVPLEVPVY